MFGRWGALWLWGALGLGCTPTPTPATGEDSGSISAIAPSITALTWSCDGAAAEWSFQVDTAGWTGGGALWMAKDADRVERHGLASVSAAADGSTDRLSLSLGVVADWRYASEGSSTAFRCSEQDIVTFDLVVYTRDGSERSDCRAWGADPELWARLDDVPDCETLLVDTGATDTGG